MSPSTPALLSIPLLVAALACQKEQGSAPPRVENTALGIAFEPIPESFVLETNEGSILSFRTLEADSDDGEETPRGGRAWVELGPTGESNINLVSIVNSQKVLFESLPGGEFFGSRELVTPSGPAYYSRGRFDLDDGERVEEIRLFQLHPGEYRLLRLHYRYPAAEDSAQRLQDLLELAGALEALEGGSAETEQMEGDAQQPPGN